MGYNSTAIILHDSLNAIRDDKDIGRKLARACLEVQGDNSVDVPALFHVNAIQVVNSHHADEHRLLCVGGNCGTDLGAMIRVPGYIERQELRLKLLQKFASEMGYTLRKRRKK